MKLTMDANQIEAVIKKFEQYGFESKLDKYKKSQEVIQIEFTNLRKLRTELKACQWVNRKSTDALLVGESDFHR